MGRRFSRQELFDQVWSVPARTIATEHGISEVAFAKYCQEHSIPVPPRGHWARAEKDRTKQPDLPPRGIGMPEFLEGGRNWSTREEGIPANLEDVDLGPLPEFAETEEKLSQRMKGLVGGVPIPTSMTKLHPQLVRLIKEDEARTRRADRYNRPLFTSPFERRRLRFLSGIFQALTRFEVRIAARGKNPADFEIRVGDQHSTLTADSKGAQRHSWMSSFDEEVPATTPITVAIWSHRDGELFRKWDDRANDPVEGSASEIVASILVYGEMLYRQREHWRYEWLVERQKALREERAQRSEGARQAAIKAKAAQEKATVDQLISEAEAYRKAQEIRAYVAAVQTAKKAGGRIGEDPQFEDWASFALTVADGLDPVPSRLNAAALKK